MIFNKGAVMVMPSGVNQATGLKAALAEMSIPQERAVGVGDGENDHSLPDACGIGMAAGNAVPALKKRADAVMGGERGRSVIGLCELMIATDLAEIDRACAIALDPTGAI